MKIDENTKLKLNSDDFDEEKFQTENQHIKNNSHLINNDFALLINNENNVSIVKKLVDENNQLKDILSKMKENAFKTDNEINQLMNEYENLENFKKFILTHFKTIGDNTKEFKVQLDKLSTKYNKIQFNFEVENSV